jgi:hypothetical protein
LGDNAVNGSLGRPTLAPWVAEPYKLWSLLEIMKPLSAAVLLTDIRAMETVITARPGGQLSEASRTKAQSVFVDVVQDCAELGLTASRISAEKVVRLVNIGGCQFDEFRRLVVELQDRIIDEMRAPRFFSLSDEEAEYYNNPRSGWGITLDRFPSALFDVEEAGKCYAFGRGTACVFHLMRVLELGLRALGASLKDPTLDPARNPSWQAILSKGDKELLKPIASRRSEWQVDEAFFSTAHANLRTVQYAWRNPTMHIERTYTDEEAKEVINSTRAFMRHLATKLSE